MGTDILQQRVLDQIRRRDVIRLCRELIRIPSHRDCPGQEKQIGEFIANRLDRNGVEVSLQKVVDDRFNVIGRIRGDGTGPSLTLTGHLDTVPPGTMKVQPFAATVIGNRVYGRGAADMKGSLAAMISAMQALSKCALGLKGDLVFAAVVGEETTSQGTTCLIKNGPTTDFAVNGEPTGMRTVIAHKGAVLVQVTAKGRAAHCDTPWLGINSIEKMSKIVLAISNEVPKELKKKRHKYAGSPTINIGSVSGGSWPYTVVPDECKVVIITGLLPGEKKESIPPIYERVIRKIRAVDSEIRAEVDTLSIETIPEGYNLPFETPPSAPIVKSVQRCAKRVLGKTPSLAGVPFWCDASLLAHAGVQTVMFGPGDIRSAHSAIEYVGTRDVTNSARIYALTAIDVCGGNVVDSSKHATECSQHK